MIDLPNPPPPAAWLAVIYGHEGRILPMAMDEDRDVARARAIQQFAGCSPTLQQHYAERVRWIRLDADEASEHAEFFAAPWSKF